MLFFKDRVFHLLMMHRKKKKKKERKTLKTLPSYLFWICVYIAPKMLIQNEYTFIMLNTMS